MRRLDIKFRIIQSIFMKSYYTENFRNLKHFRLQVFEQIFHKTVGDSGGISESYAVLLGEINAIANSTTSER